MINGARVLTTNGFTPSDDLVGDFFGLNSVLRNPRRGGADLAVGTGRNRAGQVQVYLLPTFNAIGEPTGPYFIDFTIASALTDGVFVG